MERIINIAKNFNEAVKWDIRQQLSMTPVERQMAALMLKQKAYGKVVKDVRDWYLKK